QVEPAQALQTHQYAERTSELFGARARGGRGGTAFLFLGRGRGRRRVGEAPWVEGPAELAPAWDLAQHAAELQEGLLALGAARAFLLELALEARDLLL